MEERGLLQISDPAALQAIVNAVLEASPKQLEQYRGGKTKLQGYFVGCAIARTPTCIAIMPASLPACSRSLEP